MPLLCTENSIVHGGTTEWPSQLSSRDFVLFMRYLIQFLPSSNVDTFPAQQASLIIHNRTRTCFFRFLFFSIIFFSFQGNIFAPYAILIQQLSCRPIFHSTLFFRKALLTYAFDSTKCVTSRPTTSADVAVSSPSPWQVLSSAPLRWHTGETVLISSAVPSQRSRQRRDMALYASIVSRERTVRSRRRAARSKIEGESLHHWSCAREVRGQMSVISAPASRMRLVSGS